jgi:hypothetical protein
VHTITVRNAIAGFAAVHHLQGHGHARIQCCFLLPGYALYFSALAGGATGHGTPLWQMLTPTSEN